MSKPFKILVEGRKISVEKLGSGKNVFQEPASSSYSRGWTS
ncbi:MAG: hypothetical protein ACJA1W_001070 [Akkermansiaceae bacterium]|jgi:hypothetical protein